MIVQIGAYDYGRDSAPDGFGHQYDTLIVRVERVVDGDLFDPWIRVDYWGSNRHHQEDRLPEILFKPGHRWEMRLTPTPVSEKNYQFCRPDGAYVITEKDESGNVIGEEVPYRSVSTELGDVPEIGGLKCFALTRAGLREVRDPD